MKRLPSALPTMGLTQEEILLSLVQGENGQLWAVNRIGWKGNSNEKGMRYVLSFKLYVVILFLPLF